MDFKTKFSGLLSGVKRNLKTKIQKLFRKRASPKRLKSSEKKSRRRPTPEIIEISAEKDGILPAILLPEPAIFPKIAVSDAIQEFSLVQLSPHSRRAYAKDLQDFFRFLSAQGIWTDWNRNLSPLLVARYREHLLVERKLAKSSITRKLAVVKSFCRWSLARGWIEKNPAELVKSFPQTQESKTGYLSSAELHQLLSSFPPIEGSRLFRALSRVTVETLVMLGLRRSEAASIHMKDMERLEGNWTLRVHGKGDRARVLPLPERLLDTWSQWLRRVSPGEAPAKSMAQDPQAWVVFFKQHATDPLLISTRAKTFDAPLSTSEIGRIVRQSARRAGLLQRVTPHALRATAITHALDEGASHRGVQQMAGWTSPLMITRYDKRRKDIRFSAIHHLSYAKSPAADANPPAEVPPGLKPNSPRYDEVDE